MSAVYESRGDRVQLVFNDGEVRTVATCPDASHAAALLQRARMLNDVYRRYTDAARHIARAEALPGFSWVEPYGGG